MAGKVLWWSVPGKHIQSCTLSFRQALKLAFTLSIMYHCLSLSKILLPAALGINASWQSVVFKAKSICSWLFALLKWNVWRGKKAAHASYVKATLAYCRCPVQVRACKSWFKSLRVPLWAWQCTWVRRKVMLFTSLCGQHECLTPLMLLWLNRYKSPAA